jgi:hypothetical protein
MIQKVINLMRTKLLQVVFYLQTEQKVTRSKVPSTPGTSLRREHNSLVYSPRKINQWHLVCPSVQTHAICGAQKIVHFVLERKKRLLKWTRLFAYFILSQGVRKNNNP